MSVRAAAIEVGVFGFDGEVLPKARVRLSGGPKGSGRQKAIELKFDARAGVYRRANVRPGTYSLQVDARGLNSDSREISVRGGDISETFVLGKSGMPHFWRGRTKVPFEARRDVLALAVDPRAIRDDAVAQSDLLTTAERLGLKPEDLGESFREAGGLVVRFPSRAAAGDRAKVAARLRNHHDVRHVGAVVRLAEKGVSFLTDTLVVAFDVDVAEDQVPALARRFGCEIVRTIPYAGNCYLLRWEGGSDYDILRVCDRLVASGRVEFAEPNLVTSMVDDQVNPTDFLYGQQWHLPMANFPNAWQALQNLDATRTFGDPNVVIAVMDRGLESTTVGGVTTPDNPDFNGTVSSGAAKVLRLFDFDTMVPNNDAPQSNHGTNCSGVAAAMANNASVVAGENEGVAGGAPNCRVIGMIRPIFNPEVDYSDAYIWTAGFNPNSTRVGFPAVATPGADVITNSFGEESGVGSPISGLMARTFDYLTTYGRNGRGVVLCFSAGNGNQNFQLQRPWANYAKTIAVSASTDAEVRAGYSNFGNGIDVCAPSSGGAQGIRTTDLVGSGNVAGHTGGPLDYSTNFGGTSSATPLTAGLAALILSANPNLSWVEVRDILRTTAVRIDAANVNPTGQYVDNDGDGVAEYSQWYGYGRINAGAAVNAAVGYAHPRDLVIRDIVGDSGAVPTGGAFWNSPDIWVRNNAPGSDPGALPATYNDPGPHQAPLAGQDNHLYVRVRNTGTVASLDYYLRLYIAHYPGFEFTYPNGFIPTNSPANTPVSPLAPGTYLVGEVAGTALAAGADSIVSVPWPQALIPPETVTVGATEVTWHPCLLAEVSPHDGPPPSGNHVWDNNNLGQKNISITYPDDDDGSFAAAAVMGEPWEVASVAELLVDRGKLPPSVRLYVELLDPRATKMLREHEGGPRISGTGGQIDVLDATRVVLDRERGRLPVELPAGSRIGIRDALATRELDHYNYRMGSYRGRTVAWLADHGRTVLPVIGGRGGMIPVIVGGETTRKLPRAHYEIRLRQLDGEGRTTGAVAVSLVVGRR